jgi:hypothetical protein
MSNDTELLDKLHSEFADFHEFINEWFTGRCPQDDALFEDRHVRHLARGFQIILPDGSVIDRTPFIAYLRGLYGSNPAFKKQIRNIELRPGDPAGCLLVNYQEWQRGAANTLPANHGRMVSAVLQARHGDPTRLEWLQIHETMLPPETIAAEPFDF